MSRSARRVRPKMSRGARHMLLDEQIRAGLLDADVPAMLDELADDRLGFDDYAFDIVDGHDGYDYREWIADPPPKPPRCWFLLGQRARLTPLAP